MKRIDSPSPPKLKDHRIISSGRSLRISALVINASLIRLKSLSMIPVSFPNLNVIIGPYVRAKFVSSLCGCCGLEERLFRLPMSGQARGPGGKRFLSMTANRTTMTITRISLIDQSCKHVLFSASGIQY